MDAIYAMRGSLNAKSVLCFNGADSDRKIRSRDISAARRLTCCRNHRLNLIFCKTPKGIDELSFAGIITSCQPGWRKGRRTGLKILRTQVRAGSNPALGTRHYIAGWSSTAARRAHNPKVTGSNPVPATIFFWRCSSVG